MTERPTKEQIDKWRSLLATGLPPGVYEDAAAINLWREAARGLLAEADDLTRRLGEAQLLRKSIEESHAAHVASLERRLRDEREERIELRAKLGVDDARGAHAIVHNLVAERDGWKWQADANRKEVDDLIAGLGFAVVGRDGRHSAPIYQRGSDQVRAHGYEGWVSEYGTERHKRHDSLGAALLETIESPLRLRAESVDTRAAELEVALVRLRETGHAFALTVHGGHPQSVTSRNFDDAIRAVPSDLQGRK